MDYRLELIYSIDEKRFYHKWYNFPIYKTVWYKVVTREPPRCPCRLPHHPCWPCWPQSPPPPRRSPPRGSCQAPLERELGWWHITSRGKTFLAPISANRFSGLEVPKDHHEQCLTLNYVSTLVWIFVVIVWPNLTIHKFKIFIPVSCRYFG